MVDDEVKDEQEEQQTGCSGSAVLGCMTVLFFGFLGTFLLPTIVFWVLSSGKPRSGADDEGGAMGLAFPSQFELSMLGVGGVIGSFVGFILYRVAVEGWKTPDNSLRRRIRAVVSTMLFIVFGAFCGFLCGGKIGASASGLAIAVAAGAAIGLAFSVLGSRPA